MADKGDDCSWRLFVGDVVGGGRTQRSSVWLNDMMPHKCAAGYTRRSSLLDHLTFGLLVVVVVDCSSRQFAATVHSKLLDFVGGLCSDADYLYLCQSDVVGGGC